MLDLDAPIWSTLRHAGGNATEYPDVIRRIRELVESDGIPDDELLERMWDICHQLTTYDATIAAIPHLISLCKATSPRQSIRKMLLDLIAYSIACIRIDQTTAPPELVPAFDDSVTSLAELAHCTIPFADGRTEMCRLFASLAIAQGDYNLGLVLFELPSGSVQCRKCYEFTSPFESTLNPLHG